MAERTSLPSTEPHPAPIFDTELKSLVAAHSNLGAYFKRMEARFFSEDRWPSMMPQAEAA